MFDLQKAGSKLKHISEFGQRHSHTSDIFISHSDPNGLCFVVVFGGGVFFLLLVWFGFWSKEPFIDWLAEGLMED